MPESSALSLFRDAYRQRCTTNLGHTLVTENLPIKSLAWIQTCNEFPLPLDDYTALRKAEKIPNDVAYAPSLVETFRHWTPSLSLWATLVERGEHPPSTLMAWLMQQTTDMTTEDYSVFHKTVEHWRTSAHRIVPHLPAQYIDDFSKRCLFAESQRDFRYGRRSPQPETHALLLRMDASHLVEGKTRLAWRRMGLNDWNNTEPVSQEAVARLCSLLPHGEQTVFAFEVLKKVLPPPARVSVDSYQPAGKLLERLRTHMPHAYPFLCSTLLSEHPALVSQPSVLNDPSIVALFNAAETPTHAAARRPLWHQLVYHPLASPFDKEKAFALQCVHRGATAFDIARSAQWTPAMHDTFNLWLATAKLKHHRPNDTVLTFVGKTMTKHALRHWSVDLRNPEDFARWENTMTQGKNPTAFASTCHALGMTHLSLEMITAYQMKNHHPEHMVLPNDISATP